MKETKEIEEKIGISFKNKTYLETAFTHRSYLNENKDENLENNERLEFLGDAVLELIISSNLYHNYSEKAEGELTSIRAAIVRTESLAEETKKLGVGKYLRMSKGEKDSGGEEKPYLLANLYEAILGAIYLDAGYEECRNFVDRTLLKKIKKIISEKLFIDPKTKIQEIMQSKFKITPTYEIIKEEGPDHDKSFTVALMKGKKKIVEGVGHSKQKAEEDAASNAIEIFENEAES
ncbi:MAG TPA: ribonuclease III [Candidatus Dojkabacteria bacterium]|jgi:ribonuclease-3|nr:ribonuclease III [Candidatus Dojkabacteria bacterium]